MMNTEKRSLAQVQVTVTTNNGVYMCMTRIIMKAKYNIRVKYVMM